MIEKMLSLFVMSAIALFVLTNPGAAVGLIENTVDLSSNIATTISGQEPVEKSAKKTTTMTAVNEVENKTPAQEIKNAPLLEKADQKLTKELPVNSTTWFGNPDAFAKALAWALPGKNLTDTEGASQGQIYYEWNETKYTICQYDTAWQCLEHDLEFDVRIVEDKSLQTALLALG